MTSLKDSLKKIGEPESDSAFKPIPSGFCSYPQSLRGAVRAMNPPLIEEWRLAGDVVHYSDLDWTENCQGIVTDGNFWYVVSNNKNEGDKRAVYKFSLDFTEINHISSTQNEHIGHPALWNNKLYVPVEPDNDNRTARVWVLDTDFTTSDSSNIYFPLGENNNRRPPGKIPWCAVNPWNSFLYSSVFSGVNCLSAYDPNDSFAYKGKIDLEGDTVDKVQGGCFSNNGHLYLTSDDSVDIRGYSALNGSFLGSLGLDYGDGDEIEGLCLGHAIDPAGITSFVHVIILANQGTKDDVFINHFAVPDSSVV